MRTGAIFSEDKKHRFSLWRIWDESKPIVMVCGLNPSTANQTENDATIKSVIGIMKFNGYGGFFMVNLFSYISTEPSDLNYIDPLSKVMIDNFKSIGEIQKDGDKDVVFAWGNFAQAKSTEAWTMILKYGHKAICYSQLKDGSPRHLLYCKHAHKLIPFDKNKWSVKPNWS